VGGEGGLWGMRKSASKEAEWALVSRGVGGSDEFVFSMVSGGKNGGSRITEQL